MIAYKTGSKIIFTVVLDSKSTKNMITNQLPVWSSPIIRLKYFDDIPSDTMLPKIHFWSMEVND